MRENERKKKLRKEAQGLLQSAESIYWHELEKPAQERDSQLMDECLRTIEDAKAVLRRNQPERAGAYRTVRWVAAALAALFVLAAASAGVAQAMGVDVWHLIFRNSGTGLEVEGRPAPEAPDMTTLFSGESYNLKKVSDYDEGISLLRINPLNLDLTKRGYIVDNIYISKNDAVIELFIEYLTEGGYADVTVQLYNGISSGAFVNEMTGSYDEIKCESVAGMDVYYGFDGRDTSLLWTDGVYVYSVNTNKPAEEITEIISDAAR